MAYIGAGVQRFNTADELTVTGTSELKNNVTVTGDVTASGTVLPTGDTAAGDAAALGFTSAEGLILTGQGSTSDITVKNDADATVFTVPTGTDDVLFPDDAKILMGAGSDLQIFHDGSNSFIDDAGTGVLSIRSNSISLGKYTGENLASFVADGAVTLFHDNSAKIATASTGVNITDDSAQISLTRPTNSRAGLVKVTNANGGIEYHSDVNGSGETSIVAHTFTGDAPSSDTTYMTILGSGNVGIATASPAYSLDVTGSTNVAAFRSSASNSLVHLPNSGSSGGDNSVSIASVNNDFYVRAGDAERMRIASDGDVYIGKTSEAMATAGSQFRSSGQALDITRDGGSPFNVNRLSNDGELIGFFKDTSQVGSIGIQSSGFYIDGESGHEGIRFANGAITPRENGSDSDGASDLGASNNRFKDGYFSNIVYSTYLRGQNDTDTGIDIGNTGSTADIITFMTGGSEKARIASSSTGKFFVGCTETPSSSVAGSMVSTTDAGSFTSFAAGTGAATHGVFGNGNGVVGSIQTSGSSTSYNTSSDRRLKSNIQDAESASDKIDAIQVRQFDWKADDIHQDYGLIAQELQPIEPMAVTGNADSDEMMGVDYSKLVPMLIKEIQSLRSRVAALEASQ